MNSAATLYPNKHNAPCVLLGKNNQRKNKLSRKQNCGYHMNYSCVCFLEMFCRFPETVCVCCFVRKQQQRHEMCANTTECKESFTLTPSACACRPGALRPWVLTPGVGAGWGLGAGVVKTCVFPEPCKLLDDRTLPRLPTLPLRSPPPHINTRCRTQHYTHTHTTCLTHIISFFPPQKHAFSLPASGLRSTQMSSLVLLCCPKVGEP